MSSSVKRIGLNELIDILFAKVDKINNNKEIKEEKWSP